MKPDEIEVGKPYAFQPFPDSKPRRVVVMEIGVHFDGGHMNPIPRRDGVMVKLVGRPELLLVVPATLGPWRPNAKKA